MYLLLIRDGQAGDDAHRFRPALGGLARPGGGACPPVRGRSGARAPADLVRVAVILS
jgi:hypothetical protein